VIDFITQSKKEDVMANYELFEPGDCNKPFPLNPIEDVFLFSQFVGLTVYVGAKGGIQKAVVPRTLIWRDLAKSMAYINSDVTGLAVQDGIALIDDWNADDLTSQIALEVPVSDINELLSKRKVVVNGKLVDINLDELSVRKLLSGEGAVVEMAKKPNRLLSLVRQAPIVASPVATMLYISNLPAFLSQPSIPAVDGNAIPVKLKTDSIHQLLSNGKTVIYVGKDKITLTLNPDEPMLRKYTSLAPGGATSTARERSAISVTMSTPFGSVGASTPTASEASSGTATFSTPFGSVGASAPTRSEVLPGTGTLEPVFPRSAEFAFVLPWRQTWKLLGYSRGTLLNTISLAPQEETTIDIFTWDRRKNNIERTSTTDVDGNIEQSGTTRDTSDVMNELNHSSEFSRQADGRIGVTYEAVNLNVGGAVNTRDALTSVAKRTSSHIQESTSKSAIHIKSSRQTKVSESIEIGREERVTRKIKNANMCRVLNLDYFEVLSHYAVTTAFDTERAGFCVLVPNPINISFNREALRVYERPLRRALLDPMLTDGFAAARLLDARSRACDVACYRCSCQQGTPDTSAPSWSWATTIMAAVGGSVYALVTASPYDVIEALAKSTLPSGDDIDYFQRFTYCSALRVGAPALWEELILIMTKQINNETFGYEDADRLAYAVQVAGGVDVVSPVKLLAEQLSYIKTATNTAFLRQYPNGSTSMLDTELNSFGAYVMLRDLGLQAGLTRFMAFYNGTLNAAASISSERNKTVTELLDQATEAVQSAFDLRSTAEAAEREAALLKHLTDNLNYYRFALWNALPLAAQAPYLATIIPLGLAEPRAIGSHGDKLAFPVIPDYHPQLGSYLTEVLDGLKEIEPVTEDITLPTAAVTMESRLGSCDGCEEFIMEHRELDLKQKAAEVRMAEERANQEEVEVQRYKDRLTQAPPILEDPDPNQGQGAIHLAIKQEQP
jgi:hypothetical protein